MNYWLVKTEPSDYSIDDLAKDGTVAWTGVRNYQARNFMRDSMEIGDLVLFYHSSTKVPGIAGCAEVCSIPHPDPTAFDSNDSHYDIKSNPDMPRWILIDIKFIEKYTKIIPLTVLKIDPKLSSMSLLMRGNRLSIQPVTYSEFDHILRTYS